MPRDLLFLLLGALVAIPASIAANLVTPLVKDKWASWSKSRLQKRIAELKMQREGTPFEATLFSIMGRLARSIWMIAVSLGFLGVALMDPTIGRDTLSKWMIFALFVASSFVAVSAAHACANYAYRFPSSPSYRRYVDALNNRITKLEAALARYEETARTSVL
jgi:hypothetical protein